MHFNKVECRAGGVAQAIVFLPSDERPRVQPQYCQKIMKLNVNILYDAASPLLDIYPAEMHGHVHFKTHTRELAE
jgi:hypothetical protein